MTKTQKQKHERRTVARFARNIAAVYAATTPTIRERARDWYRIESDTLRDLALELGLPLRAVCGAAAAISPGMRWDRVGYYVEELATGRDVSVPTYSTLFVDRARACLAGDDPATVLGGDKVRAFYALLVTRGQADAVVIDGHAFNIARGERSTLRGDVPKAARVTAARYRWAEQAYRRAAATLGLEPHELQAITWTQWRIEGGIV